MAEASTQDQSLGQWSEQDCDSTTDDRDTLLYMFEGAIT